MNCGTGSKPVLTGTVPRTGGPISCRSREIFTAFVCGTSKTHHIQVWMRFCNTFLSQLSSKILLFHISVQSDRVLANFLSSKSSRSLFPEAYVDLTETTERPVHSHSSAFRIDGISTCDESFRNRLRPLWTTLCTPLDTAQ